jgi:hypothetical protein
MSDLARTDFAEYRLRSFISELGDCETIEERNQTMKGIIGEAADILTKRPDLLRRWLLGLDRVNKRFMLMKQHVAAGPNESLLVHSAEVHAASTFSPEPGDTRQSAS